LIRGNGGSVSGTAHRVHDPIIAVARRMTTSASVSFPAARKSILGGERFEPQERHNKTLPP
jgi:hypothetical protein